MEEVWFDSRQDQETGSGPTSLLLSG